MVTIILALLLAIAAGIIFWQWMQIETKKNIVKELKERVNSLKATLDCEVHIAQPKLHERIQEVGETARRYKVQFETAERRIAELEAENAELRRWKNEKCQRTGKFIKKGDKQ